MKYIFSILLAVTAVGCSGPNVVAVRPQSIEMLALECGKACKAGYHLTFFADGKIKVECTCVPAQKIPSVPK